MFERLPTVTCNTYAPFFMTKFLEVRIAYNCSTSQPHSTSSKQMSVSSSEKIRQQV